MASAKANKKAAQAAVNLPECPVCMETMTSPIVQCCSGHSLCGKCSHSIHPPICPICRQPIMMQMRNWELEKLINMAKVACPNKNDGCTYVMASKDVEDHVKECIFRHMECPIGSVLGRCSWIGKLQELMDHFKNHHPANCNVSSDTDIELPMKIDAKENDRYLFLFNQGKIHFLLTMTTDILQKMVFCAIQLIGSKNLAFQHIYEIHLTSMLDNRRKVVFIEHCFNDSIKADEVFRQNKCAMMPFNALKHFVGDKKILLKFLIKKNPPVYKDNKPKGDHAMQHNKAGPNPRGIQANKPKKGPGNPGMKPKKQ